MQPNEYHALFDTAEGRKLSEIAGLVRQNRDRLPTGIPLIKPRMFATRLLGISAANIGRNGSTKIGRSHG